MEACADLLVCEPEELRGRWLEAFGYDELHIELGCGKGRFTVESAKAAQAGRSSQAACVSQETPTSQAKPGVFIAALEKSADAMIIALERAKADGLRNVRFVNAFADNLAKYFAPGEASRIYICFCDPWPSNRHAKRRLTARRFLELYSQVLRPGGEVHFKTDNLPLFDFSLREFESGGYAITETARDLHKNGPVGIMTDYELKFHSQGLPVYKIVSKKLLQSGCNNDRMNVREFL